MRGREADFASCCYRSEVYHHPSVYSLMCLQTDIYGFLGLSAKNMCAVISMPLNTLLKAVIEAKIEGFIKNKFKSSFIVFEH